MQEKSGARPSSRLVKLADFISPNCGIWLEAMMAEAEHVENRRDKVLWKAGMLVALLQLALRQSVTDDGYRPIELTATAVYLLCFSGYILAHLLSQLLISGTREPWYEAWFPIFLCFWLAIIPSLLAVGVWVCDDFARKLVIAFTAFELANVIAYAHSFGTTEFRVIKFFCTLAVLAAMFTPRVKNACCWRPMNATQKLLNIS